MTQTLTLTRLEQRLLDEFQHDFPLTPRPYAALAERLDVGEREVIAGLTALHEAGAISRIGAVVRTGAVGASTLAAMAVPAERLASAAALVNSYDEVNHNYERAHRYNLWFVVTARDRERIDEILAEIGARSGYAVLDLPMTESYRLNLGFPLEWS